MATTLLLIKVLLLAILVDGLSTEICRFGDGCEFPCHCKNGAACDGETGECPDGCDDGRKQSSSMFDSGKWYGPGCQIGNVAYKKHAKQRTIYKNDTSKFGPQNAVDGGTNQHFESGKCSHQNKTPTWWEVNLRDLHLIYNITIYHRNDCCKDRIYGISVRIGNTSLIDNSNQYINDSNQYTECSFIEINDTDYNKAAAKITKQCSHPMLGQYVALYNKVYKTENMEICEVYVRGFKVSTDCPDGFWGPGCLERCKCETPCDYVTHSCTTRCHSGWIGKTCQHELPSLKKVTIYMENRTETNISISFMQVLNPPNHMKQASYYVVQYRPTGYMGWIHYTNVSYSDQNETITVTVDNLVSGTRYDFQVLPVFIDGVKHLQGEPTAKVTFQTEGTKPSQINIALITGGSAAALVVLLIILIVVIVMKKKKQHKPEKPEKKEPEPTSINQCPLYVNIGFVAASSIVPRLVVKTERNEPMTNGQISEDIVLRSEIVLTNNDLDREIQPKVEKGSNNEAYEGSGEGNHELLYQNMQAHPEYNIPVKELTAYIQSTRNNPKGFEPEYKFLPEGALAPWNTGETKINKNKNRFKNFSAYDHSRVVLTIPGDKKSTDYINGSFIKGYPMKPKTYIAVQGPREWTVNDMWRLIFQEKVNLVIMVTNLVEAAKEKSSRYWPELGHKTYGDITVELSQKEVFADFVIRTLKVVRQDNSRKVHHYHFTSWPDHGVPSTSTAFLEFHHRVQSFLPSATGPMMVHCSAGIGRTGTFIAIDYLLKQAETEDLVNVFDCVNSMRSDRYNMVQTQDQYEFIYDTLLEALRSGNTAIPSYSFSETFKQLQKNDPKTGKNKLQEQFEVLDALKSVPSKEDIDALDKPNLAKNRNLDIYPENGVRPYLLFKVPGCNDYINAAYINGYKVRCAYIITQSPLPNTVNDLWRLALDHRCHTIIALNETGHVENVPQYWPNKDEDLKVGTMNLTLVKEDSSKPFTTREFSLTKKNQKPHTVRQIQSDWEEEDSVPCSASLLLNILEKVEEWSKLSGQGPIIVHCVDGAKHSGLVVAAMYLLDKMKVDQEVNVFHTVKYIRTNRPQLITSLDQYIFLHTIAQSCMEKYDTYANFKKI